MPEANVVCIVVTFNGEQWIEQCLNSISKSTITTHVICIDNGSTDTTINIIQEKFPGVQLMKTAKNLGFGQANNLGFSLALAKAPQYLFLLNQDAFVFEDTIASLVNCSRSHPQFGIVSPLHLNGDGSKFDAYFLRYLTESNIAPYLFEKLLHGGAGNTIIDTSFVNAAAWLITVDCLKKVGGFDSIFFHYGEDKNYCQRVLSNGYKIGICTASKIMHDRELRTGKQPQLAEAKIKKEWTHFLTIACDVSNQQYKKFMLKEFISHAAKTVACALLFDKANFRYHLTMAAKIPATANRIQKSRKESLSGIGIPHL